jgi:CubicO group peptidase (beta-lactamase class C family)
LGTKYPVYRNQGTITMTIKFIVAALAMAAAGTASAAPSIDPVEAIVQAAQETRSSGVIILRNGEPVVQWLAEPDGEPIETMSVTKSIVALGVARMLTTGELESLDMPLANVFPEWRQGRKADITVRHLLNHTSGLQNHPNAGMEIYPSPDVVQLALAAELDHAPGEHYAYNNKATNLIAGLFEPLTGRDMAVYIGDELLAPLGVTEWDWMRDEAGNPYGMAGLQLHPRDLAHIGQLILDQGRTGDRQLIDAGVLAEFLRPGSELSANSGLLWWLQPAWEHFIVDDQSLQELQTAGVEAEFLERLGAARGKYPSRNDLFAALSRALGDNWIEEVRERISSRGLTVSRREGSEEIVAFYGDGYLGQYVVVVPATGIVGVRMIRRFDGVGPEHQFPDFRQMIAELD